jgi:4a-hydroxytetrahydrobiopterin dehydratase
MQLQYVKLDEGQINSELHTLEGWSYAHSQIQKTFTFDAYKTGLVFATAVGYLADKINHHPDISIGYQKVTVAMNTHDIDGISPYDFELARQIEGFMGRCLA